MPSGPDTLIRVGKLSRAEKALSQSRAAIQSGLDPIDLDQVDTYPLSRNRIHIYSTVTVLARLRG
jgi:hypothetical protein